MSLSNHTCADFGFAAVLGLVGALGGCALQAGTGISTPDDEAVAARSTSALTSYTKEYTWEQGAPSMKMLASAGSVCFLTGIHGRFSSTAERVKVSNVRGFWYLTGSSHQAGVGATARCFPYDSAQVIATEVNDSTAPSDLDLGAHRVCALSRVSGDFQGSGDVVRLYQAKSGHWFLQTAAASSGLNGGALCLDDAKAATLGVSQLFDAKAGDAVIAAENFASTQAAQSEPQSGSVCFLTRMTGKFTGPNDRVDTHVAPTSTRTWNYYLRAQGAAPSVATSGVCLN